MGRDAPGTGSESEIKSFVEEIDVNREPPRQADPQGRPKGITSGAGGQISRGGHHVVQRRSDAQTGRDRLRFAAGWQRQQSGRQNRVTGSQLGFAVLVWLMLIRSAGRLSGSHGLPAVQAENRREAPQ